MVIQPEKSEDNYLTSEFFESFPQMSVNRQWLPNFMYGPPGCLLKIQIPEVWQNVDNC